LRKRGALANGRGKSGGGSSAGDHLRRGRERTETGVGAGGCRKLAVGPRMGPPYIPWPNKYSTWIGDTEDYRVRKVCICLVHAAALLVTICALMLVMHCKLPIPTRFITRFVNSPTPCANHLQFIDQSFYSLACSSVTCNALSLSLSCLVANFAINDQDSSSRLHAMRRTAGQPGCCCYYLPRILSHYFQWTLTIHVFSVG
jgi:hypothetical protein